jgi:carbon storage regulator CsrA
MLVLTRKIDESIVIGDNIVVKVIAIENGNVKLGI